MANLKITVGKGGKQLVYGGISLAAIMPILVPITVNIAKQNGIDVTGEQVSELFIVIGGAVTAVSAAVRMVINYLKHRK